MVDGRARNIHPNGGKPLANLSTLQARNKSPLPLCPGEALLQFHTAISTLSLQEELWTVFE